MAATARTAERSALRVEHLRRFRERFGGRAPRLFFAPGRVNLMGAHLDYNGGPVMPTAVDRGTLVAVRPRDDARVRLASTLDEATLETSLDALPERPEGRWYDYPLGVLRHLAAERSGPGLDVLFGGDLPIGAGLSSSASICVGTAFAVDQVWRLEGSPRSWIDAALYGEREFVGVRCGIMDPYAVALARPGHLLWLDCKDASTRHVPLDSGAVAIAVADSGVRRDLAQGAFNERVRQCARAFEVLRAHAPEATCLRDVGREVLETHAGELGPEELRRARHVAGEVERTFAGRDALERGDLGAFGRLVTDSHRSLQGDYEVSIPELDLLVEAACDWQGCYGSRLTGAGFGGCTVAVLDPAATAGFADHLGRAFERRFGRRPRVEFFRGDEGPREVEGS